MAEVPAALFPGASPCSVEPGALSPRAGLVMFNFSFLPTVCPGRGAPPPPCGGDRRQVPLCVRPHTHATESGGRRESGRSGRPTPRPVGGFHLVIWVHPIVHKGEMFGRFVSIRSSVSEDVRTDGNLLPWEGGAGDNPVKGTGALREDGGWG